jgi:hypothetical protein
MSTISAGEPRHPMTRSPLATPEVVAKEPKPFPATSIAAPRETWFLDWRRRLTGNLSRRSDGRWEPLTRTHGPERADDPAEK